MDSRDIPQPQHQELLQTPHGMLLSHYPNFNIGAMMGPNSTPIHPRLTFGSLAPLPQQMDQKTTLESLGHVEEVSPSSQPMRFGMIDQNQNEQQQQQVKRKRGRPRNFGSLAGTSLAVFTPHVIEVNEGEDILTKVVAFSNQGPRTVSVLSATGAVSAVTFRRPPSGIENYKGRFDIVKLGGSFFNYEVNGSINRSGSLTVVLASPDNQIFGGLVGQLVAATPVQVIVGSFFDEAKKPKLSTGDNARGQNPEPVSAPANNMLYFGSNSQGPSSESSDENEIGSPSMQHHDNNSNGIYGNSMAQQHQLRNMQMYNLWPSSGQ